MKLTNADRQAILANVADSDDADMEDVEALLATIVSEDRDPSPVELRYLKKVTSWSDAELNKHRRRVNRKLQLLAVAGTAEDRDAAQVKAKQDAQLLATEGARIEAEIANLTNKLETLRRDAKLSSQRVTDHEQAVLGLRECLPVHIQSKVDELTQAVKGGPRKELGEWQIRQTEIRALLDTNARDHAERVRHKYPEAVSLKPTSSQYVYIVNEKWPAIAEKLQTELGQIEGIVQELETEVAKGFAELDKLRDYHIHGLPE